MPHTHSRKPRHPQGLPSRQQVLDFIAQADEPAGKREIAKVFGLKGQEKIQLKALLRDMADEGLIDGNRTAFHRMGGVPRVTVLRVIEIEDGEPIAIPATWQPDDATPPPRLRLIEAKGRGPVPARTTALPPGDREASFAAMTADVPELAGRQPFKNPVDAGAQADTLQQLIGWYGRQPFPSVA